MRKELKDQHIDALCEEIKAYPSLYIADIGGLNSVQTSKLRRAAFRNEVKLEVVKNTLLIKALEKSGFDYSELFPVIKGHSDFRILFRYMMCQMLRAIHRTVLPACTPETYHQACKAAT